MSKDLFFFSFFLTNRKKIYIQISQKTKNTVGNITKCTISDNKKKKTTINVINNINIKIDITTVLKIKTTILQL